MLGGGAGGVSIRQILVMLRRSTKQKTLFQFKWDSIIQIFDLCVHNQQMVSRFHSVKKDLMQNR